MVKGSLLQGDFTTLKVYVPSNNMRQGLVELQGEIDEFTLTVTDFNTPLSEMDRSSRQEINTDIFEQTTSSINLI